MVTRSVSLVKGGFGRYGAPMCPFDPGKMGSLAMIHWDDGPGTVVEVKEENVGEMTEENEGGQHDSCGSCSSRKRWDGDWDGAPTFPF